MSGERAEKILRDTVAALMGLDDGRTCEASVDFMAYAPDEVRALRLRLDVSEAEVARLRAALTEIARPKIGPEVNDTDEEWHDYWQRAVERERTTARNALEAER